MAVDHIRYDLLAQDALRSVVRKVLADTAKSGLLGDHHFYISIDTHAEGVGISDRLRVEYPEEITVILQHQFWDLAVYEDRFEVGLSFSGVPERLVVPFAAIKGFFDPAVQFGLQFETIDAEPALTENAGLKTTSAAPATKADAKPAVLPVAANPDTGAKAEPGKMPAEVVRLDRFRKK
jgi:hypothetical protein